MLSPKASKLAVHVVGRNSAIRYAVPENPTLESNMKWIGRPVAEIWPLEIFEMRGRSSVGRWSLVDIYILTLISYTALRYVRNVAREVQSRFAKTRFAETQFAETPTLTLILNPNP